MRPIRVLHVDDEPDFADLAAEFLERENDRLTVATETSAEDGLDRLSDGREDVDCVVSDYEMPGMDGLEFLERVREERPDLPFILFTGRGSEEVASEAVAAGATDYLQKETGTDQYTVLANRIDNAVAQYRAERRARDQDRVLSLLRNVNRTLVGASTREEITEGVTEALASTDPYQVAWIGEYDAEYGRVVPRTVAGVDGEAVSPVSPSEEAAADGVVLDAIRTHEVSVTRRRDPTLDVWSGDAPPVSYEAAAVLPIVYHGERYGLLALYADRADDLDDEERRMFEEMAGDVAQAMHVAETRRTLRRHQTAVEAVPEGVFVLDENASVVLANDTASSLVDSTPDELRGERFLTAVERGIFDEAIIDWYVESVREMLSSSTDADEAWCETEIRRPDGEVRAVEIHLTLRPYDDDYNGTVGIIRDVTDRKDEEAELRRRERQFEAVFEDPQMLVGLLDAEGTLRHANQTAMEFVDADVDDLTGTPFWETPWWSDDSRSDVREWVERAATGEYVEYEAERLRSDGRQYSVSGTVRPVSDDAGEVTSLIVSARDVTERKRRERRIEALHDATRYLFQADSPEKVARIAVETTRDVLDMPINGFWLYDDEADVLEPTVMTDRGDELLAEQPVYEPGESLTWDAFRSGETMVFEDVSTQPGRLRSETVIRSEIVLPIGEYGIMNIGSTEVGSFEETDISIARILASNTEAALKRAESRRELARQNERLEEFARIVSHDLRNPLTVAEGRLELVRDACDSEHIDAVERAHDRMAELIDDLLTVARGKESVTDVEPVGLADAVADCWRHVETADAALVTETERVVHADERRLRQLLENLVGNAVEHGGADVTVTVGDVEGGFYVADDGRGIPEADRENVFETGYTTSDDGTGFGLSIVEQAAEVHGWDISVSESADGGARFDITGVDSPP